MNVSGISNSSDYQQVYAGRSKERTSAPVSFGYGEDSYTSSVAASYIQKQQQEKAQQALAQKKKEQWKQFGWDVLKGVIIGGILLGGYKLFCSNSSGEMQKQTKRSLPSTEGVTLKHAATTGDVSLETCKNKLKELNIDPDQQGYILDNICIANASIREERFLSGVKAVGNRGAILFGRAGVGKSYAMEQIAKACDASYVSIKGSDFMNKYQGESEGNLQGLMEAVREEAEKKPDKPVLIFMDEGESILGSGRTTDNNNTNAMLRSIFLGAMETEGTDALPPNVKFIVTSNFVNDIDEPYQRDGRLGVPMELQCPNIAKQKEIMQKQFKERFNTIDDYNKYKEEIENYIDDRYKYMKDRANDENVQKYNNYIAQLENRLAEQQANFINAQREYISALANNSDTSTLNDKKSAINTVIQQMTIIDNGIEQAKELLRMGNEADSRYFNFTPAEIKGLTELIVSNLFVPGKNRTLEDMKNLEIKKIQSLRSKIKDAQSKNSVLSKITP